MPRWSQSVLASVASLGAVSAALASAAPAHAGAPGTVPSSPEPAAADVQDQPSAKPVGLVTAGAIGVTVAGAGAFVVGAERSNDALIWTGLGVFFVAPSGGQLHAGNYVSVGMVTRLVGAGLLVTALAVGNRKDDDDSAYGPGDGAGVAVAGGLAIVTGAVIDLALTPRALRRWNNAHRGNLAITPTVLPSASGPVSGLAVAGSF